MTTDAAADRLRGALGNLRRYDDEDRRTLVAELDAALADAEQRGRDEAVERIRAAIEHDLAILRAITIPTSLNLRKQELMRKYLAILDAGADR